MKKYQVFLSSASKDLSDERMSLINSLFSTSEYFPIAMENFTSHTDIINMLYSYMLESDIYVLIIKNDIGSPIKGEHIASLQKLMDAHKSISDAISKLTSELSCSIEELTFTQIEYAMADALDIQRLAFVYDDGDNEKMKRRLAFVSSTTGTLKFDKWSNISELELSVKDSLKNCVEHNKDKISGWVKKSDMEIYKKSLSAGIIDVNLNGKKTSDKLEKHLEDTKDLCLFFTTGYGFIYSNQNMLANHIAHGGNIKLLCAMPFTDVLNDVAKAEMKKFGDRKDINNEFFNVVDVLGHILKAAENIQKTEELTVKMGTIEVGDSGTLFRSSIVVCKSANGSKWGWITITLPPEKSIDMVTIEIEYNAENAEKDNLMHNVYDHFDKVWEIATSNGKVWEITPTTDKKELEDDIRSEQSSSLANRPLWEELYKNAVTNSRRRGKKLLIEVAAQHPLDDGMYPNDEFARRLDKCVNIYRLLPNMDIEIYVPGSIHLDERGIADVCSLSSAGIEYLVEKGVPREILHGDDWNDKEYEGRYWQGVYNSGDECYVAAKNFNMGNFTYLVSICSPNQCMRKSLLYIANGVIANICTVTAKNMFHSMLGEIYESIPNILANDFDYQSKDSKEAIRTRIERMPDFNK